MIALADFEAKARSYLRAAHVLVGQGNAEYDAAAYLCGYAVEIALKVCICRERSLTEHPDKAAEFAGRPEFSNLKTHDLLTLLNHSGWKARVLPELFAEWSAVEQWNPEQRYGQLGTQTPAETWDMIEASETLLGVLLVEVLP